MIKFSKTEIKKAIKTQRKNIINGKGYKTIKMVDTKGKTHKVQKKEYFGILKQWNLFAYNNGRYPNTVTFVGKSKEPIILNYQDNSHQCACASFNMCVQGFGEWINEGKIAKTFGTGSTGTAPSQIIEGAKKLGYKVKVIPRNLKAVKEAKAKGYGVIAHIDTIKAPSLGYKNNYGHYVCIARVTKAGNYRVFDPTKGVHSIKPSELDNAMLNRKINYYAVIPQ